MTIEFIGSPGAGKTSLLPIVISFLRERGVVARTLVQAGRPLVERSPLGSVVTSITPYPLRRPLLWQLFARLSLLYRLRFARRHADFVWHVLCGQFSRSARSGFRWHVFRSFAQFAGYYELLKTHELPDEALVYDQGFIHRVIELNASDSDGPMPDRIARYLDLVPMPDLLIYVHAPRDVCVERVWRRGLWKHFRRQGRPELIRLIANSHRAAYETLKEVRSRGWKVIEIDNGYDNLAISRKHLRSELMKSAIGTNGLLCT